MILMRVHGGADVAEKTTSKLRTGDAVMSAAI
jgi:hypothetical protein